MKCEQAQKLISDRLDGKLSRWKETRLARHLTTCELCRDYLKAQEVIQREALKIEKVDCPPEWWRQFEQALQEKLLHSTSEEEAISVLSANVSVSIKEDENNNKRGRFWTFKTHARQAASLLMVVVAVTLFLILFIRQDKKEGIPFPLTLSYEDSYFNLSQILADDEEAASNFASILEETILEEAFLAGSEATFLDIDYDYEIYNNINNSDILQAESINSEEGL